MEKHISANLNLEVDISARSNNLEIDNYDI